MAASDDGYGNVVLVSLLKASSLVMHPLHIYVFVLDELMSFWFVLLVLSFWFWPLVSLWSAILLLLCLIVPVP
jgi:hypothetical protein